MESVCESGLNVPVFSSGAQECPKCVLTSLTRKISMRCRCKHSHGVLHRVTRFIELSLYLPFNIYTREGQKKSLQPSFFLFTWVHLYKGGSVYIKYEPLSFMPCNMDSVARLVALRHYLKDNECILGTVN